MSGTLKRITTNYGFKISVFDSPGWNASLEYNFDLIDAVLTTATGITGLRGEWVNNTYYGEGDRVYDPDANVLWQCAVSHTSAASGSFADDRAARPTFWNNVSQTAVNRGQWLTGVVYNTNEYVFDNSRFGVVNKRYTSGASYSADVAAGNINTLIDLSTFNASTFVTKAGTSDLTGTLNIASGGKIASQGVSLAKVVDITARVDGSLQSTTSVNYVGITNKFFLNDYTPKSSRSKVLVQGTAAVWLSGTSTGNLKGYVGVQYETAAGTTSIISESIQVVGAVTTSTSHLIQFSCSFAFILDYTQVSSADNKWTAQLAAKVDAAPAGQTINISNMMVTVTEFEDRT